ncbi:MAG: hypothetical protein RLZZ77_414 [Bacteroidota bacterium]
MFARFRKIENLHIAFWLVKDLCWVADIKWLGVLMIVPTVLISCWFTWKLRSDTEELAHNFAVTCWIVANSIWMTGEFFWNDSTRHWSIGFFSLGLLALIIFYASRYLFKKN